MICVNGMSGFLGNDDIGDRSCHIRNEDFERILSTVVNNGLRAGWLSLGHNDGLGDMLPMLDPSKQKPLQKPSTIIGAGEGDPGPTKDSAITNDDGSEMMSPPS